MRACLATLCWIVIFLILSTSHSDAGRRTGNYWSRGRGSVLRRRANRQRNRGSNSGRSKSSSSASTVQRGGDADDVWDSIFSPSSAWSSSSGGNGWTSYTWSSSNGNQWSVSAGSNAGSSWHIITQGDGNAAPDDDDVVPYFTTTASATTAAGTTASTRPVLPWRGQGSFTGDLRLDCLDRRCTRGAVQVYNREERTWGNVCGDRWTKKESQVVCNYLQFSKGARRALKLYEWRLSRKSRVLPTLYKTLTCLGNEKTLIECRGVSVSTENPCESTRFAGVVCAGTVVDSDREIECSSSQVPCGNRQKCIESNYKCDGMSDCPWGTDEESCQGTPDSCPTNHFWCGQSGGGCISNSYLCDGDEDCVDGNDERNCEDHLSHFTRTEGVRLRLDSARYESGWRNISPYLCAKKCREEPTFHCISFDYSKQLRECDLSSLGSSDVGVTSSSSGGHDHYEISVPHDCESFLCVDLCLPTSQVCDGERNCPDGSDEASCDDAEAPSLDLRLTGGFTPRDGRVEIRKRGGAYGLICDIGWTINEADVACRQLGYINGALSTLPGLTYRRTSMDIKLSGVTCTGNEQSLADCQHDPWHSVSCPRDHEAGVACRANGVHSPSTTKSPISTPRRRPTTTTATTTRRTTTSRTATTRTTAIARPSSPSRRACGQKPTTANSQTRPRIVGGNNADPHEWPWQVGIWLPNQLLCGGTLIDQCWVLTAAHCFARPFPTKYYVIRLGDYQSKADDGTEQDFKIKQLIKHTYDTRNHDNDIALIELEPKNGQCAVINNAVQLACLPTSTDQFQADETCHIVGWGQTQMESSQPFTPLMKEAKVPLIGRQTCIDQTEYSKYSLTSNMLCAGYLKGGIDTCQGDSGGPLLCRSNDDRYYIWGIVSWGNGCARPRAPGVYTIVANYLDWIQSQTGINV